MQCIICLGNYNCKRKRRLFTQICLTRYIIRIILITEIRQKNEFNNVPQRVLASESQEIFI